MKHRLREGQGEIMQNEVTVKSIEELIRIIDELPDDTIIKIDLDEDEDGDENGG